MLDLQSLFTDFMKLFIITYLSFYEYPASNIEYQVLFSNM